MPRPFFVVGACTSLLLGASLAATPASSLSCPKADSLLLTSTSETVWTITCSSATKPLISFDPLLLRRFEVEKGDAIVVTPDGAPQPTKIVLPNTKIEIGELKSSVLQELCAYFTY
ncbi:hypothetical protein PINS_up019863 [Pythium insidiosum]|nr:hypothetical protein PINS_up007015 [Pythium insidiosum]GLD98321.1 hypothetical protein PINS_up007018 [Pythium insidiosum]GLE08575.1 hypothetical protein PINS_up019860 [Pythium insidiosum]GLE08578.1 hypothetical protein PINS_up019863 [Pythium insidiosum]